MRLIVNILLLKNAREKEILLQNNNERVQVLQKQNPRALFQY